MTYYVYLLRCEDGSLYAGITTDPDRRLREHRSGVGSGGAKYTSAHRPTSFAALWETADRAAASRLEYRLKKLSHGQKEALIRGEDPLPVGTEDAVRIPV